MYRSDWDFEQHARHLEREAMAAAERARLVALVPAARRSGRDLGRGPGRGLGLGLVAWLRASGARIEAWVAGTPRRPTAAPAPCRERAA